MSRLRQRLLASVVLFVPALVIAGCTAAGPTPTPTPSRPMPSVPPSPNPSASASAAAEAAAAADEAELPMPTDEIAAWAANAVPGADDAGYVSAHSGWISAHTTPTFVIENRRAPAGDYAVQFACAGDGEITLTIETLAGDPLPGESSASCTGSTSALRVSAPADGVISTLTLEGAPTVYALSFHEAAPTG